MTMDSMPKDSSMPFEEWLEPPIQSIETTFETRNNPHNREREREREKIMFVAIFDKDGNERDFDCGGLAYRTAAKLALLPEVAECFIYEKREDGEVENDYRINIITTVKERNS